MVNVENKHRGGTKITVHLDLIAIWSAESKLKSKKMQTIIQ